MKDVMQKFVLCLFISTKVTHGALWMSPAVFWADRLDVSVAVKDRPITRVSFTRQCVWLTSYNTSTRWKTAEGYGFKQEYEVGFV